MFCSIIWWLPSKWCGKHCTTSRSPFFFSSWIPRWARPDSMHAFLVKSTDLVIWICHSIPAIIMRHPTVQWTTAIITTAMTLLLSNASHWDDLMASVYIEKSRNINWGKLPMMSGYASCASERSWTIRYGTARHLNLLWPLREDSQDFSVPSPEGCFSFLSERLQSCHSTPIGFELHHTWFATQELSVRPGCSQRSLISCLSHWQLQSTDSGTACCCLFGGTRSRCCSGGIR